MRDETRFEDSDREEKTERNGTDGTGMSDGGWGVRSGGSRMDRSIDRSIDGGDEKRAIHDAGRSGANQLVADVSTK